MTDHVLKCSECNGEGQVDLEDALTGRVVPDTCPECDGEGQVQIDAGDGEDAPSPPRLFFVVDALAALEKLEGKLRVIEKHTEGGEGSIGTMLVPLRVKLLAAMATTIGKPAKTEAP